jgi:hypothetical protein
MLPKPDLESVLELAAIFDQANALIEDAIENLWRRFPHNTNTSDVLLKVVVLNQLYSARVLNIHAMPLAEHIVRCHVDPLLDEGDVGVVESIVNCPETKRYYSFATKYCNWHRARLYPIWDLNVDECLWYYQKQYRFYKFRRQDLRSYGRLVEVVRAFSRYFELGNLDFKEIDKFLWQMGDRLLKHGD